MPKQKGFTLIELLVVVAIISILAGILFVSIGQDPLKKSRDSKRRADLSQLQLALERYAVDNGGYPSTGSTWHGNCSGYGSYGTSGAGGYIPNLAPAYLSVLPLDPKPAAGSCYLYNSDGTNYKVLAYQTMEFSCPPIPTTDPMWDSTRSPSQCTISVYTPGASAW